MDFENLYEGEPIQNPPLFEKESVLKWKSKFENQDDQFDLTFELEVLEILIDRHLVEINTCATSLNVFNEGISEDDFSCRTLNGLACVSWTNTDEDVVNHPVCDSPLA